MNAGTTNPRARARPQAVTHAQASVVAPRTHSAKALELSIVLPCLNEAETVGICVRKAVDALRSSGIVGEVIVADNGSSDGSQQIAASEGARVVAVQEKGYG